MARGDATRQRGGVGDRAETIPYSVSLKVPKKLKVLYL